MQVSARVLQNYVSNFPLLLRNRARNVFICLSVLAVLFFCAFLSAEPSNTNIFSPASTPSREIHKLGLVVLSIAAGIFVVLMALLVYVSIRYRSRERDHDVEPPQIYGSTEIETAWTIIPILIIIVLFLTTAGVLFALQSSPKPSNALDIVVVGHQFWWEYRYPLSALPPQTSFTYPRAATLPARPI